MAGGPTGTVTFLFTDVEGSTRLWQDVPGAMAPALARHDEILRAEIGSRRGVVFSTAGDAFAAAFWTPREAVDAAMAVQAELAVESSAGSAALRVRIGVHTGTADERDGDYFGPTLNRAARIMASGHGGQVLVSDATAKLLAGADLRDLGEYRLKDLNDVERVWQVGAGMFPPLRAARARGSNLPSRSRSFVGRSDDCKRLMVDVHNGRVVTLVGAGGVGKTRLALEVAHDLVDSFADGVWWCDLAPIDDPVSLAPSVAAMLSIMLQPDMTPIEAMIDGLHGRRALVVFDNCEHLLDAAAELIAAVVEACPSVAAIATSREPLGAAAEQVWPVRPLDPDLEAADLFVERAVAADASFHVGDDRAVLVELCHHLDGLPLAIELAAAQVRAMTPAELLARLHDRVGMLRGARGGVDRHRTLVATLDWSYSLLDPPQKVLFDRLAVFPGSFDVVAAEAICSDDVIDAPDVIELIVSLVDKSMVVADRSPSGTRFRLLETMRHYGQAHAAERDDFAARRGRHLDHYVNMAEATFASWLDDYTSGQVVLDREWDNVRAAVQHALAAGDVVALDRLFSSIQWPSLYMLRFEVTEWAAQATALSGTGPATFGAAALLGGFLGRFEDAERWARTGITIAASPEAPATTSCWLGLAAALIGLREPAAIHDAIAAAHRSGGLGLFGNAMTAAILACQEIAIDPSRAAALAEHAEEALIGFRNQAFSVDVLSNLGLYYGLAGDPIRGLDYCRRALTLARAHDARVSVHTANAWIAQLSLMGRLDDPIPALRDALAGAHHDRVWMHVWTIVAALAASWADSGHLEAAAICVGYLDAHHFGTYGPDNIGGTRTRVETDPHAQEWLAHGAHLDRDQLVAYLLDDQLATTTTTHQ